MGCRDAVTNHQRQILKDSECSLTGFKALINSHSSFETSALKDSCKTCRRKTNALLKGRRTFNTSILCRDIRL